MTTLAHAGVAPTPEQADALATRLFRAIERGDVDAVAELYADDVAVWHNTSGRAQTKHENLALLKGLTERAEDWRYEDVRRRCYAGGCSQQHVLRGKLRGRDAFAIPVCIVLEMAEGRIRRIDEYLDSAALGALFGD
jgi:ketosteroid isomerase-like protein